MNVQLRVISKWKTAKEREQTVKLQSTGEMLHSPKQATLGSRFGIVGKFLIYALLCPQKVAKFSRAKSVATTAT